MTGYNKYDYTQKPSFQGYGFSLEEKPLNKSRTLGTKENIEANRAIFLYHLRVNPGHVKQITGTLANSMNEMCAVGLGCDALHIPMMKEAKEAAGLNPMTFDPYAELAKKLDVPDEVIYSLYRLNDQSEATFAQVAEVADRFFQAKGSRSISSIWAEVRDEVI